MGRAALADERFGVALYWLELVRTWAPSSLQTELETCQAAGAVPALPVRRSSSNAALCVRWHAGRAMQASHLNAVRTLKIHEM